MTIHNFPPPETPENNSGGKKPENFKSLIVAFIYAAPRAIRRKLASRKSHASILSRKVTFRETLTAILLMIPSTATVMLTYYGVSVPMTELGGDIVQKGQALAFALTIGIFAYLTWLYLFGLLYRMRRMRLTTALVAGVISVISIALIDAPFNMLALGGGSAVQMTLVDTTDAYESRNTAVFNRATIAQRLLPAFTGQAVRFRDLENSETKYGTFSGRSGPGKVSAGFGQIATLLESLIKELDAGLGDAKGMQSDISGLLSQMKRATFTQGPIRPRVEIVSTSADRLDDLIGRLVQLDYGVSIQATLTSLKAIFPAPTAAGSDFEKTQNKELALIADMARPVAGALETALAELNSVKAPSVERVRPQDAMKAIRTKWRELFPQWMAAIFIDIGPAALLIILIAAFREVEVRQNTPPPTNASPEDSPKSAHTNEEE